MERLSDLILAHKGSFETIAVVCETVQECQHITAHLNKPDPALDLSLMLDEKSEFKAGVSVLPVFLAKGLEFDAVIVPDASAGKYGEEYQRRLLYVACSRALHSLNLINSDNEPLSPFILAMEPELYVVE